MFRHGATFVISAQHNYIFGVIKLEAEQENADFEGKYASINIVAQEKQVRFWDALRVNHLLKHVDHVVELAVDVTNNNYGFIYAQHIRLISENPGNFR